MRILEFRLHIERQSHLFRPLSGWPQRLLHCGPGATPIQMSQWVLFQLTGSPFRWWGSLPRSMGHIMRFRGKTLQDSIRLIVGCSGWRTKGEKGMNLCDLGTRMRKQEKVNKRHWLLIYRLLFCSLLWLCRVLSRVCFMFLNSLSKDLLYVHMWGLKSQQVGWDPGPEAQMLVVQATGESTNV